MEVIDSGAVYTLALKTHVGMSIDVWRYFAGWADKIQVMSKIFKQQTLQKDFLHIHAYNLGKHNSDIQCSTKSKSMHNNS